MASLQKIRPLTPTEAAYFASVQAHLAGYPVQPAHKDGDASGAIDDLLTDLTLDDLNGTENDDEVIEALTVKEKVDVETIEVPRSASKNVSDMDAGSSKFVSATVSKNVLDPDKPSPKNVSENKRRSPENDRKIVAKMRNFRLDDVSAARTSLVSDSSLPDSYTSYDSFESYITGSPTAESRKPSGDNSIPVWDLIGDYAKSVCAAAALQIDEKPAIAFTFNLTPDATAKAKADPDGFLDALKRPFDQNLKRAGIDLPYFFAVDIDDDGRLHLHGAFRYPPPTISSSLTDQIRTIMKASWGEWTAPGKHKQLHFQALRDDDWATYCVRNSKAVRKMIGPRTFTITQSLGKDAKWFYNEFRRIMKDGT